MRIMEETAFFPDTSQTAELRLMWSYCFVRRRNTQIETGLSETLANCCQKNIWADIPHGKPIYKYQLTFKLQKKYKKETPFPSVRPKQINNKQIIK